MFSSLLCVAFVLFFLGFVFSFLLFFFAFFVLRVVLLSFYSGEGGGGGGDGGGWVGEWVDVCVGGGGRRERGRVARKEGEGREEGEDEGKREGLLFLFRMFCFCVFVVDCVLLMCLLCFRCVFVFALFCIVSLLLRLCFFCVAFACNRSGGLRGSADAVGAGGGWKDGPKTRNIWVGRGNRRRRGSRSSCGASSSGLGFQDRELVPATGVNQIHELAVLRRGVWTLRRSLLIQGLGGAPRPFGYLRDLLAKAPRP